jgi:hypothetical protein
MTDSMVNIPKIVVHSTNASESIVNHIIELVKGIIRGATHFRMPFNFPIYAFVDVKRVDI